MWRVFDFTRRAFLTSLIATDERENKGPKERKEKEALLVKYDQRKGIIFVLLHICFAGDFDKANAFET